jgi:hypothetical protein
MKTNFFAAELLLGQSWHAWFCARVRKSPSMLALFVVLPILAGGPACGGHTTAAAKPAPPPPPAKPIVPAAPPLCSIKTDIGQDKSTADRSYPTGYWMALVVGGYHGDGDYTHPPRDCRDSVARIQRDGCAADAEPEVLPARLLTVDDLVVTKIDDTHRLVWAMTDQLSDGQAQGPVAIAEIRTNGIDVRALGILRAYPKNVSLRLEHIGDAAILVADGEHCEPGQTAEECARAVRLLPLVGDRFVPKSLIDADGACMGRAFIPVRGSGAVVDDHRTKYRIETLVTFAPDAVVIREQLAIDASGRKGADIAKSSYVTRVQADRRVTVRAGNLVATGPSLLTRWLSRQDREPPPSVGIDRHRPTPPGDAR